MQPGRRPRLSTGSNRSERVATSQTVTSPSSATAAKRVPVGREGERGDLAAGLHEGCADLGQVGRIDQGDALVGEADRDQPAVGAEPARDAAFAVTLAS